MLTGLTREQAAEESPEWLRCLARAAVRLRAQETIMHMDATAEAAALAFHGKEAKAGYLRARQKLESLVE